MANFLKKSGAVGDYSQAANSLGLRLGQKSQIILWGGGPDGEALIVAIAAALRDREVDPLAATLCAQVGVAAFVTAFEDRDTPAFRKAVADLAWGSFAWCLSEPDHLIAFDGRSPGAANLALMPVL